MRTSEVRSAVDAAKSTASALGLTADEAIVLHNSNRLAVRLLPCDVLARIAHSALQAGAAFEVEVARRLAESQSPAAALDQRVGPGVYAHDGYIITFWKYYEPAAAGVVPPKEYAQALGRLHAGMREIELIAPRFQDRIAEAQRLVDTPAHTPDLGDADRELLGNTLRKLSRAIDRRDAPDQLLHGEPHPGNLLRTKRSGLLFIDFETCCRGPVEFDLAHSPEEVSDYYPGADRNLLRECRILSLAMVATWRWQRDDQFPHGRRMGLDLLAQIRADVQR